MDNVQIITQAYPTLTAGEQKIADAFFADPQSLLTLNIVDFAKKANVSTATVSRFAQHLGCENYRQLQIMLARQSNPQDDYILNVESQDATAQISTVMTAEIDAIRSTYENLDPETLKKCARLLNQAKHILFFGLGASYVVGLDATLKYKRLHKFSIVSDSLYDATISLASFTDKDVVIGVSYSGETAQTCKILELAKSKHIPTIALTTFPTSSINKQADYSLYSVTREAPKHSVSFTSRVSQMALLDMLFLAVFNESKKENLQKLSTVINDVEFTDV